MTLLGELYSLTTSPSGRARPLGEVAKDSEYSSLSLGLARGHLVKWPLRSTVHSTTPKKEKGTS